MFTKILKYEFKACLRYYLYCFAFACLALILLIYGLTDLPFLVSRSLPLLLSLVVQSGTFLLLQFLPLIRSWQGFYGREAYFSQGLPISEAAQFWSKATVSAGFLFFHYLAVIFANLAVLRFSKLSAGPVKEFFSQIKNSSPGYFGFSLSTLFIIVILMLLLNAFAQAIILIYITIRGHSGRLASAPVPGTIFSYIIILMLFIFVTVSASLLFPWALYFGEQPELIYLKHSILSSLTDSGSSNLILPLAVYPSSILLIVFLAYRSVKLLKDKYDLRA